MFITIPYVSKIIELKQKLIDRLWWRGGSYKVTVQPQISWPVLMPGQIEEWLKENTKSRIYLTLQNGVFIIRFKNRGEAMAFKLAWL